MVTQKILEDLPELYRNFLPSFFYEEIPLETYATCNDCAMCAKEGEPLIPGVEYYSPNAKCCTFHPKLPNYLIGGLLADGTPGMEDGRRRIREKIQNRVGVSPYGILPPKKAAVLFRASGEKSFGKTKSLLCPYFVSSVGGCSIWKFREAVCTTYFCKTVAGPEGKKFWNVLKGYLIHAQDSLTWYTLQKMDLDIEFIWEYLTAYNSESLDTADLDELPIAENIYQRLWSDWAGREEEYFKESFEIVSELSREEFENIAGITQVIFLNWLKKKHQDVVSPLLPEKLKRNPDLKAYEKQDGDYILKTEAGFYTIQKALFEALELFDGSRTKEEIARIVLEKWDDTLDDELLIPLYQTRMLIPA